MKIGTDYIDSAAINPEMKRGIELAWLNERLTSLGYAPLNDKQQAIYLSFSHDIAEERVALIHDIKCRILS